MTNLEKLRAAIIEAVPDIKTDARKVCTYKGENDHECSDTFCLKIVDTRAITLADILRAVEITKGYTPADLGGFTRDLLNNGWLLPKNLDDQSPECIAFLTSVLCNG